MERVTGEWWARAARRRSSSLRRERKHSRHASKGGRRRGAGLCVRPAGATVHWGGIGGGVCVPSWAGRRVDEVLASGEQHVVHQRDDARLHAANAAGWPRRGRRFRGLTAGGTVGCGWGELCLDAHEGPHQREKRGCRVVGELCELRRPGGLALRPQRLLWASGAGDDNFRGETKTNSEHSGRSEAGSAPGRRRC